MYHDNIRRPGADPGGEIKVIPPLKQRWTSKSPLQYGPGTQSHKHLFSPPVCTMSAHSGLSGYVGHALHIRWRRRSDGLGSHG